LLGLVDELRECVAGNCHGSIIPVGMISNRGTHQLRAIGRPFEDIRLRLGVDPAFERPADQRVSLGVQDEVTIAPDLDLVPLQDGVAATARGHTNIIPGPTP
jgi:hypothetical protein